jgi:GrpB-like predicted nucleotidyltransferase (UPF0157 family)
MMIVISAYDAQWPAEFEIIRAGIASALGPLALRIDHIGSTSVPGLGAKDVIDVQITVGEITDEVKQRMLDAGFQLTRHVRDHVPEGEDPTPALWQKLLFNERAGERRANIHIRKLGNPNQRYALLFRDYLRAHPKSAMTVERIKRELAQRHGDDMDAYYAIKDPVYDLIWDAAQEWARFTKWQQ